MKCPIYARTQSELAGVLGMNPRTLRDWIDNHGLECFENGKGYHLPTAIRWAVANRWTAKEPTSPKSGDAMEDAKLRYKVAAAAIARVKAVQLLESVVDRDSAVDAIDDLLGAIRDRLQKVPAEVATAFPDDYRADAVLDFQDRITLIVREIDSWQASQAWSGATVADGGERQQPQETESEATIEAN